MAIVAAAIVPIAAMIGGGVDMSRAYMAKTQLQAACDAGVLAGRRAMAVSGQYSTAEQATADTMFNANFDAATIDASNVVFTTNNNEDNQVLGSASITVPTAVMQIFSFDHIDLAVDCMAEMQVANTDVMFVLDTTGSMGGSKIQGLRDAVRDFHATIADAVVAGETRVRYGFVPYSTSVNASGLIASGDLPTSYFVDQANYQSKEALFDTPIGTDTVVGNITQTATFNRRNDCQDWADNYGTNPVVSGAYPSTVTTIEYTYESYDRRSDTCTRRKKTTEKTFAEDHPWGFTTYRYRNLPLNTSAFKTFANVPFASSATSARVTHEAGGADAWYNMQELAAMNGTTASNVTVYNSTWEGCIVERDTVQTGTFNPFPSGAYDLNITLAPTNDATRWRPLWSDAAFNRGSNPDGWETTSNLYAIGESCPSQMVPFTEIDTSSTDVPDWLDTYLNGLVATGNTYHDIGMIWGGRLGATNGIFADNVNAGDVRGVSRHLIFMTDGQMEPNQDRYVAYGIEKYDHRIGPAGYSNTQLATRHTSRFSVACEAVKAQGYTVWVILFGASPTTALNNCATNPDHVFNASNTDELRETFRQIASQVADLRLGQ